jgi:DNA-binding NarL/FixJ family response regulator
MICAWHWPGYPTAESISLPPPLTAQIGLSGREADVLHLVAHGWTNKEIAHRLRLELQTVKNHVGRILRKLGVRSRFDVARAWATRRRSRP